MATKDVIGTSSVYTDAERVLIERVERKMEEMMSKYDPSHDAYHGMSTLRTRPRSIGESMETSPSY